MVGQAVEPYGTFFDIQASACGVAQSFRLFMNFLVHKMIVTGFFDHLQRPVDLIDFA